MTTYFNQPKTMTLPRPGTAMDLVGHESHELDLSVPEWLRHSEIMGKALSDPSVQGALGEFSRFHDIETYLHCLRVGELTVAAAMRLGMSNRDILVGAKGALTHDIGKSRPSIHRAVKAPETFADKPRLLSAVRQHPSAGAVLAKKHGLDENVRKIIGLHHSLQTDRVPYGTHEAPMGVPEADGFTPNIPWLIGSLAVSDVWDALTIDAKGAREYLNGQPSGSAVAERAVASLNTDDEVKSSLLSVVGRG